QFRPIFGGASTRPMRRQAHIGLTPPGRLSIFRQIGRPSMSDIHSATAERPAAAFSRGRTALLVLADGTVFEGFGFGAETAAVGEVCFNTAMTGYEEILTDPSYAGQIVAF